MSPITKSCLAAAAWMLLASQAAAQQGPAAALPRSHYAPLSAAPLAGQQPAPPSPSAPLRLAPRSEKSKPQLARPADPSVHGAVTTVVGGLSVVLGLFVVIAWCSRRFAPPGATQLPKEVVELLGRAPLAGRLQAQLVRVGNKLLFVAVSAAGVETLTEISDAAEVEHLTALCRRGRPGSAQAAFDQVLSQLASDPRAADDAMRPQPRGVR